MLNGSMLDTPPHTLLSTDRRALLQALLPSIDHFLHVQKPHLTLVASVYNRSKLSRPALQ